MRTREPRRIVGKPGPRKSRVSKKAPNEPKKVWKGRFTLNGCTLGGFLVRKVSFCSTSLLQRCSGKVA